MYCNFFKLSERPFELTPDPKFLYLTPGHREILASLIYGIRERRGFMTMIGEPGTGKTTLLRAMLDWIDKNIQVAFICNTDVTFEQMLNMALIDLGLSTSQETLSKVQALDRLNTLAIQELNKGANVALIVDEAQNLGPRSLENLRLLSNLETAKRKLIQIVLSGQPELDGKLNKPNLRQLAQRISLKRYITPLTEKETYEYIQHRLTVAGCKDPNFFSLKAQHSVWEYSGGVPRRINILSYNALLIAFGVKEKRIKGHIVEHAIRDLVHSPFSDTEQTQAPIPMQSKESKLKAMFSPFKFASSTTLVIAACLFFILGLVLGILWLKPQDKVSFSSGNVVRAEIPDRSKDSRVSRANKASPGKDAYARARIPPENALENVPREKAEPLPALSPEKATETLSTFRAEDKQSWKSVTVRSGDTFSKLVARVYGDANPNFIRLVREHNPQIEDTNKIEVGQKIVFPPPYTAN